MDHNLGDALNLDSSMGVDFGNPEDPVNQVDISLEHSGQDAGIPMEFEHIEVQPMLMDTGSEEIIDFIGEQFTLQEYAEHEDPSTVISTSTHSAQHNILTPQSDVMIEIEAKQLKTTIKQENQQCTFAKTMAAKPLLSPTRPAAPKKSEPEVYTSAPRQIAIAPKPPPLAPGPKAYIPGKQFAIAPKPIALLTGKNNSFLKKVTLAGVMQANNKGNTVLTQIGKQLVMMPAGGAQKLKLLTTGTSMPSVQYIKANTGDQTPIVQGKNFVTHQKPVVTKLILQGQPEGNNSQTVLTKVNPVAGAKSPTRFVTMQQKTMPLSLGNKVLLATPTKTGVKFAKKQQIIAFKSPEKLSQAAQGTTKKVLITSNPAQNVILKTTAPSKTTQITKDGKIVLDGHRTQLHQINVPGKGIQYIRLITNSNTAPAKPKPQQQQTINIPTKTFLLTDSKGNLIQMTSEKTLSSSQQPLFVSSNTGEVTQLSSKSQQKLVRIAPFVNKSVQSIVTSRSSQSLLAPLTPLTPRPEEPPSAAPQELEEMESKAALRSLVDPKHEALHQLEEQMQHQPAEQPQQDSQQGMQHDTQDPHVSVTEVEVEFKRDFYSDCDDNNDSMEQQDSSGRSDEDPLIVIPSNYIKENDSMSDNQSALDDSRMNSILNVDADVLNSYQSPHTPQALSESDIVTTELGLRPRKACNCTKSQCLKLYCECFANGEFCNRCNCNNCHNNLENEELRQKAIRGCLDRNPNAFRPKIGKAKLGGPDIVRRHNKGCNCKRSGCLKNYCECYEAKIACTSICKCVGCRNVEETLERARRRAPPPASGAAAHSHSHAGALYRPPPLMQLKQPCSFMTTEVIEAVCQCLLAAGGEAREGAEAPDPARDVIDEFARCLQDIISAAHHSSPLSVLDEGSA